MGMFDEVYCDAPLPDDACDPGTCFQTKSFPFPCMCRYRITASGRFTDSDGNDIEPSGYVTFYAFPKNRPSEDKAPGLAEYRAKFADGNLDGIVRVNSAEPCEFRYGLASFRWFESPSFMFGDDAEGETRD
jgi:hypothetical protein